MNRSDRTGKFLEEPHSLLDRPEPIAASGEERDMAAMARTHERQVWILLKRRHVVRLDRYERIVPCLDEQRGHPNLPEEPCRR